MPKRKIPKSPCASPSRDGKTAKRKGNLTIGSLSSESGAGRKGKEISGESSDEAEAGRHSAAVSAKGDETEDVFEDSFENFRSPSENFRSPDRSIWCEKGPIIPGVHKPDERSEPLSALESEMILYRKLKNNNVFVETFNNWPSRAYFVHEDKGMVQSSEGKYKPVDSEAYFSIVYSNNALRETEPVNSAEKYVMKLFENMGIAMKFSLNKEWTTCSGIDESQEQGFMEEGELHVSQLDGGETHHKADGRGKPAELTHGEASEDDYFENRYTSTETKKLLFGQFCDYIIFVDKDLPSKIWFLPPRGNVPDEKSAIRITNSNCSSVDMSEYREKWEHASQASTDDADDQMCAMMTIFEEMGKCVHWDESTNRWVANTSEEAVFERKLFEIAKSHRVLTTLFVQGSIPVAFSSGMTDSCARAAIQAIFSTAAVVAFGEECFLSQAIKVYQLGSSRAHLERFPVHVLNKASGANKSDLVGQWKEARRQSESDVSVADSNMSYPEEKGELHTDVVVITSHVTKCPRFLFLAAMKSSIVFTPEDEGQMVRELISPMMNQNFCFGLLINTNQVRLYIIERSGSEINYEYRAYSLKKLSKYGQKSVFDTESMKDLYIDIVAVLDFAKNKLRSRVDDN